MGAVEQDLARYERDQDRTEREASALEHAGEDIRAEITGDAEELAELLVLALESGDFQLTTIAKLMMRVKAARSITEISVSTAEALVAFYLAIEPYLCAEIERRAPQRVEQWKNEAEDARADAIRDSRDATL